MGKTIPRADFPFNMFQLMIVAFVTTNMARLVIDKAWYNDFFTLARLEWEAAWTAYQDVPNRTKAVINRKNTARKRYEKLLAMLILMLKADPGVTDEQLQDLNIADRTGAGKPAEVPTEIPHFNVYIGLIRHILIYFGLYGKKLILTGRPHGVHGAEIKWGILDFAPKGIEDLHDSAFCTSSHFDFEFTEEDRGKIFYFCIRWENTVGKKGPWSEITAVRIP
jgi:hypothetical protein